MLSRNIELVTKNPLSVEIGVTVDINSAHTSRRYTPYTSQGIKV